jgi:hypothetical protein
VSRTKATANNNPLFDQDEETLKAIKIDYDPYVTLNVDGGMINNEPFDKVRQLLNKITGQTDRTAYESYEKFQSTVIMIAPFPSTKPAAITLVDKLLHVAGLTLSAMISQMRAKANQIKDAMDPSCAGQFLIDPSRQVTLHGKNITLQGERAIACGALGGFSGFLNKEFRVHDFFLGRHNCKIFLRDYFTVSEDDLQKNEIFRQGYQGVDAAKFRGVKNSRQIIPIVNDDPSIYDFPELNFSSGNKSWPKQHWADIDVYTCALKERIGAIILNLVKLKPLKKIALMIGTRILLRGMIAGSIMKTLKKELSDWDLLIDFPPEYKKTAVEAKEVKFNSQVITNARYLDVSIQGDPVPCEGNLIKLKQSVSDKLLTIAYRLTGPSGSNYTINYNCTSNDVAMSDPGNLTGFNGTIGSEGHKEVTLSIPL